MGNCSYDGKIEELGKESVNQYLSVLSDHRRRFLLYYLRKTTSAEIGEAARRVVAWNRELSPENVPESAREKMEVALYHLHLPKLVEAGLIEYDDRSSTIRFRDAPSDLLNALEWTREHDGVSVD